MKKETAKQIRKDVENAYDNFAKDWDTTRQYDWPEFEIIKPKLKKGIKVLDLGCGNGRLYELCKNAGVDYVGIDNSKELIKLAQKNNPEGKFMVGDALDLPFGNEEFDLVISFAVVHHIPSRDNREKFFVEAARVLKNNGDFFVTTWNIFQPRYKKYIWENRLKKITLRSDLGWNDAWIPFGNGKILRYIHGFTPSEMRKLLNNNFEIEREFFTHKKEFLEKWENAYNLCYLAKKYQK